MRKLDQSNLTKMNVEKIEAALMNEDASPPALAQFSTILVGYYSYFGQMLKRIQLVKPQAWIKIHDGPNDKPPSDKMTEKIWQTTKDGQAEIALEWELKRIEKMVSSINKRLYVDNQAAKNNY